jgi:fatty-acyl-CoA synthase
MVSIMTSNQSAMLAAHYSIPPLKVLLNLINTRLDTAAVGWMLEPTEIKLVLCDEISAAPVRQTADKVSSLCKYFQKTEHKIWIY